MTEDKMILLSNLCFGYQQWAKKQPPQREGEGPHYDPLSYLHEPEQQSLISSLLSPSPTRSNGFYCSEYDKNGYTCEEQCDRCKKTNDFEIAPEASPVNEIDWKVVESDILDILFEANGTGSGADEAVKYFKSLAANVPSAGYSLEQVDFLLGELRKVASPIEYLANEAKARGQELNGLYAVQLSNSAQWLREIANNALVKWSQTDQGKQLLNLK